MKLTKHFIFLICSAGVSGCFGEETEQNINPYDSYKNKKHYEVNIGDTISIYNFWNGNAIYNKLDQERRLLHVEYLHSKTVSSTFDCEGCTNISADKFISKSKGKDTIIYSTFYFGDTTVLNRDTFFVTVK